MLSKIDPFSPTSYKVLPPKFTGPYYEHLMQIHRNLKAAKGYWFSRDARVINDLLIRIDAAIFKMLAILDKSGTQLKFAFSSDELKSCFRQPPKYEGPIDWKELRQRSLESYDAISVLLHPG